MNIKQHHRRIMLFGKQNEKQVRIVATFTRRTPTFPHEWDHWPQDEHLPMEIWGTPEVAGYLDHHLGQPDRFAVAVADDGTGDAEFSPVSIHVARRVKP